MRGRSADIFSLGCVFLETWTVWAGESLEEFAELRSSHIDESYHANLPTVTMWINKLGADDLQFMNGYSLNSNSYRILAAELETIRQMLSRDPQVRQLAE